MMLLNIDMGSSLHVSMMRLKGGERWPKIPLRDTHITMNAGQAIKRYAQFYTSYAYGGF